MYWEEVPVYKGCLTKTFPDVSSISKNWMALWSPLAEYTTWLFGAWKQNLHVINKEKL